MIYKISALKKIRICVVLLISLTQSIIAQFETLENLQKYAQTYPENVKSDNNDAQYPDFIKTYKKEEIGIFEKIKNYILGIKTAKFDAQSFKKILEEVLHDREQKKLNHIHEAKIELPIHGTIVFWGSLFASYHSLVRTLTELYNQKIINNNLEIIKKNCYFVFIGDAINFAPYSLVTLMTILVLMKKNPDKVFYIKGQQENNGYWENFDMRFALRIFAPDLLEPEDFSIPFSTSIKKFFNTLPDILIVHRYPEEADQALYVSHTLPDEEILKKTEVEVVLIGEKTSSDNTPGGLEFMGYNHGTATWSLMSCPNTIYQDFYKFYYDSFVIFEMGDKLLESVFTTFNQDVRKKNGFSTENYDVLYGIQLKDKTEVKKIHMHRPFEIGSTMPLYGGAQIIGRTLSQGINISMYNYNRTNAADLNLFIRNNIFDDQLIPRIARGNVKKLHDDYKIDFLLLPVGTPTLASYLPTLEKENIFVFFPLTGTVLARNPLLKNIINLRASYADEVNALIDYMITEYRSKRFAFFYQNDVYGTDALAAAHNELTKRGITTWTDIPYRMEETDLTQQAKKIKAANPDAIGFFSNSAPTQEVIDLIGTDFFMGINLFGISFLEGPALRLFLKERGISFTFSSVFPNPKSENIPILKEYHKALSKFDMPYTADSLEGYIVTELFLDALVHTKPKVNCFDSVCTIAPEDRRSVMNYLENLKNYNFKGLNLTFDPTNRSFNLPLWIENEDGKWIEYYAKTGLRVKNNKS